jgi:hypothetical protein
VMPMTARTAAMAMTRTRFIDISRNAWRGSDGRPTNPICAAPNLSDVLPGIQSDPA